MDDKTRARADYDDFNRQFKLRYCRAETRILRDAIFEAAREQNAQLLDWYLEYWQQRRAEFNALQPPEEIRTLLLHPTLDDGTTLKQAVEQQNNPDMLDVLAAFEAGRTLMPMERWCEDQGIPKKWPRLEKAALPGNKSPTSDQRPATTSPAPSPLPVRP